MREAPPTLDSGTRSAAYRFAEGWHLRQWALRSAVPLAALATNGAGWLAVRALPDHRTPLGWLGAGPATVPVLLGAGLGLVVLCAWLRVLAKGVLVRKTTLTTGGVYRRVRHPFYLANLIGALGVFLIAGPLGAVVGAIWLAMAAPVFAVTVRGEEDGLATLYPEAWAAYAAQVPSWLPLTGRAGPDSAEPARVTWANLVREREPPRLARFLAGAALVGALGHTGSLAIVLVIVSTALFLGSHLLPSPRPRRL